MPSLRSSLFLFAFLTLFASISAAEPPSFSDVQPLFAKYCYECHGNNDETRKADLNLEFYATEASWMADHDALDHSLFAVEMEEMPPTKASPQPSDKERELLIGWLAGSIDSIANASNNDPGLVVAPRLNHLEYDLVIEDLIGHDVHAAEFFPRDSGGGEGFTNVGEDLAVEVGLLENWLEGARQVMDHARIFPVRGVEWQAKPAPSMNETQAAFYPVRVAWEAWHNTEHRRQTREHRDRFTKKIEVENEKGEKKEKEIETWVGRYLEAAWYYENREALGAPDKTIEAMCEAHDPPLIPSILERFHGMLTMRPEAIEATGAEQQAELARRWQAIPSAGEITLADVRQRCDAINDRIYEGGPNNPIGSLDNILRRTSSSGLGGQIWTPFSPYPGMNMNWIATEKEQRSSGEAEVKDLETHPLYLLASDIRRNASQASLAKLDALVEEAHRVAHPDLEADRNLARSTLREFASKAWRLPVSNDWLQPLLGLYDQERAEGKSLDYALKQALTAVLVSPRFLYRFQKSEAMTEPRLLTARELATRLSFALWARLPDEALRKAAASGVLLEPDELAAQVDRMVADPKARALGQHFAAQWLHFADFAETAQPDLTRYPDFSPEVARDMQEEATRFFIHLFQENRPVTWIVNADSSEMSLRLAGYYGLKDISRIPEIGNRRNQWQQYDLPENRRGLLGMGAILIGKSQPLRTSPIKRGAWVIIDLLGTPMPDPPPGVAQISDDEVSETGLTVAEQMAIHRADPNCSSCHQKLDPMGLALENFGPDGRWRQTDTQGNALITEAAAPDGSLISGIEGLVDYLEREEQREQIAFQFSTKLLGYLLGRKVELGDRELLERMVAAMADEDWRVMPALQTAIASKQFRYRRDEPADMNLQANLP